MSAHLVPLAERSTAVVRQSESVGDDAATRTVLIVVALLVVVGVGLAVLAVWLWRATRPEPQLLAPLELMDERRWRRLDPQGQRRSLDSVRPEGAAPISPSKGPPTVDSEFAASRPVTDFADLAEPDVDPARAEIAPDGAASTAASVHATPADGSDGAVGIDAPDGDGQSAAHVVGEPQETDAPDSDVAPADADPESTDIDDADSTGEFDVPALSANESADDGWPTAARAEHDSSDDEMDFRFGDDDEHDRRPVADDSDDAFEFDVPLMPGEGLLRRRSEEDRT